MWHNERDLVTSQDHGGMDMYVHRMNEGSGMMVCVYRSDGQITSPCVICVSVCMCVLILFRLDGGGSRQTGRGSGRGGHREGTGNKMYKMFKCVYVRRGVIWSDIDHLHCPPPPLQTQSLRRVGTGPA